ncbi:MAG: hypothetical protein PVF73_08210 [Bacteroidales bacterium]|jgi:hypothetical protein
MRLFVIILLITFTGIRGYGQFSSGAGALYSKIKSEKINSFIYPVEYPSVCIDDEEIDPGFAPGYRTKDDVIFYPGKQLYGSLDGHSALFVIRLLPPDYLDLPPPCCLS